MGEIEKLRHAREAMNEIFPLTPVRWEEWTRDEASISTGPEPYLGIEKIYEGGVSYYLHVAKGYKIREAYRAFELAILHAIDESNIKHTYQNALEMYNARADFEEQIARQQLSDSKKFQQFMIYLNFELSSGDPAHTQLLYERDITEFPISSDFWRDYTRYSDKTLKMKNADSLLPLYAYWACLELNLGKDQAAACSVWESLVKICGSMLEAWQGYIAMEIELGHLNEAGSIYRRCYSKRFSGTGSEHKVSSRLSGSLEHHTGANKHSDSIRLKGRNTFAILRNVRPLGVPLKNPKPREGQDEKLKSDNEFREMFLKK